MIGKDVEFSPILAVIADVMNPQKETDLGGWIFSWRRAHNNHMVDNKGKRAGDPSAIPKGRERTKCAEFYSWRPCY
jgi:hypothetical protein